MYNILNFLPRKLLENFKNKVKIIFFLLSNPKK